MYGVMVGYCGAGYRLWLPNGRKDPGMYNSTKALWNIVRNSQRLLQPKTQK